jgi:hypothetical protein
MSTWEKRLKKRHKNGCPLFFVSDFRFLHTLPTGKGKKADIYQKRRFAFGFVFYRFCADFLSIYFVQAEDTKNDKFRFYITKSKTPYFDFSCLCRFEIF